MVANRAKDAELGPLQPLTEVERDERVRVLVADDEPELLRALGRMLTGQDMDVILARDGVQALGLLETTQVDVALVDLVMPNLSGLDLLKEIRARYSDVEVVMMTAFADVETAVTAVRSGAYNFLTKPFRSNDEVGLIIRQAAERRRLKARAQTLERRLAASSRGVGGMVGNSPVMREAYLKATEVAPTKATVLILGESGTGKELTARAIHEYSNRNTRPFVTVNCSAIPEGIVESELFGHVKGAFTNATSQRSGLFEAADCGTLFLDEVGDLPLQAQVKVLRVLQEGEVKRVGSNETRVVDVRVIAATNLDLKKKIEQGSFREDLYYRLNVVAIHLPPLRERPEDIPALAYHFLRKHAEREGRVVSEITPSAMELLMEQPWPGNVRELENAIERAVVFCKDAVTPEHLGLGLVAKNGGRAQRGAAVPEASLGFAVGGDELSYRDAKEHALLSFERHYFSVLRERTGGNVSEAARRAGLDRSNFRRAVRRAGVAWRSDDDDA